MDCRVDELAFHRATGHPTRVVGVLVGVGIEDIGFGLRHENRNLIEWRRMDVGQFQSFEPLKNNTSPVEYPD